MTEKRSTQPQLPPAHTATLLHVNQALAQTADSAIFLQQALDELCALLQPACASVLLLSHEGDELAIGATTQPAPEVGTLPIGALPAVAAALEARGAVLDAQPGR